MFVLRTKTCLDMERWCLLLVLTLSVIYPGNSHPQCLDFRAPFQPETALNFCSEYSDLGCCGSANDDTLKKEFEYIQSQATPGGWSRCQHFVKDILCQKCSPYAAHIYDAEGKSKPRGFPGLCTGYCEEFYEKCRNLVWFLDPGLAATNAFASKNGFCRAVALQDVDYCFPDLLSSPVLLRNLSAPQTAATPGCLCLEVIRNNLANPLWAHHAGDGSGRLFVAEQKGRVRIYDTRTKNWKLGCFLDFTRRADVGSFPGDERGFLGLAFHPNYASNGRFFVYYSTSRKPEDELPPELEGRRFTFSTKIRISELRVSSTNPDKADPNSERVLLDVLQPYNNHNGGELMFGVDGYLYAFIGDGGGGGDPMRAGQNKSLLHGKVIRLDVDSDPSQPYTIPPDNPFVGETGSKPEIYAYGVRNIWRCGLDRGDRSTGESRGRIVCGDVGQNLYEELDLLKKGVNYGWNSREGFECYDDDLCGNIGPEELPIHAYDHSLGKSVTGGVFYRGCESPALNGKYIYGDYTSSRLWSLTESGGVWTNNDVNLCGNDMCQGDLDGTLNDFILSFGEDEDGEIYVLTSQSAASGICNGRVYKIIDPSKRNDPQTCTSDLTQKDRVRLPQRSPVWEADERYETSTARIVIKIRSRSRQSRRTKTSTISRTTPFRRRGRNFFATRNGRRKRKRNGIYRKEQHRNRPAKFSRRSRRRRPAQHRLVNGRKRGTSGRKHRSRFRTSNRKKMSGRLPGRNSNRVKSRRQRKRNKSTNAKTQNRRKTQSWNEEECSICAE